MPRKPNVLDAGEFSVSGLGAPLATAWRRFAAILGGRYRPERHYMRGPGPKWQERHSARPAQSKIEDPA